MNAEPAKSETRKTVISQAKDELSAAKTAAALAWAAWDKSRTDADERIALAAQSDLYRARIALQYTRGLGYEVALPHEVCGHKHRTKGAARVCREKLLNWSADCKTCSAKWYNSSVCQIMAETQT